MPTNLPSATNADYIMRVQEEILTRLDSRGGSMSGTLDMAGHPLINASVFSGQGYLMRGDAIVSNPTGAAPGNIATFTSPTVIQDGGVQLNGLLHLTGGTMAGSINLAGNSLTNVGIISGPTHSRSGDNVVSNAGSSISGRIATFSGSTGKVIQDGGIQLSDLLHLSGGNMTGSIDSLLNLNLGINLATSISIGRSGVITNVNGLLVSPLPKASWYSIAGVSPSFTANVFRTVPLIVDNSQGLVDFTVNNINGNLTYTGALARTFTYTCNLNISFTNPSTLSLTININAVTGFSNSLTGYFWDVSIVGNRRLPFHMSGQITLNPGDTIILAARWGNTSAAQVTFGRCSFHISALPN